MLWSNQMRSFGGPRKRKRGGGKSLSIHETIVMHRRLGTFVKNSGPRNTILTSDWNRLKNEGKEE
tara:strand:+ start:680 stop:874 length:195 start_codon:yes stop_codon:yes gene_type:complete